MENKKVEFKIEEGNLIIIVDMNQDGESLLELKIKLAEVLDEIASFFKK